MKTIKICRNIALSSLPLSFCPLFYGTDFMMHHQLYYITFKLANH